MTADDRQSTGIAGLDERLDGGLVPGTLTVIVGATGIGKTQLGLQFLDAGRQQEGRRGVVFDVSARGDSQNHANYARRMFAWELDVVTPGQACPPDAFFDADRRHGDYLHIFDYSGRRVTRQDLDWDEWRQWQAELNAKLQPAISYLYGNFMQGCRRVVVDGIEPSTNPHESIQLTLFEYIYHQIIRKDPEWVARDALRQDYRQFASQASEHLYDGAQIGCVLLITSQEALLDELIVRPLAEGDALSNANTLIYMGKTREGKRMRRGMFIAKHRGSACSDEMFFYEIDDQGLKVDVEQ